jgi:ATPase subunit of ABC transporter with duplicated ATPase domains
MSERVLLRTLPKSMVERAARARSLAVHDASLVDVDDEMLPWVWDCDDALWYSFDGNYSASSPEEKREKARARRDQEQLWQHQAQERASRQLAYSLVRDEVLKRDKNRCRMCKAKRPTPFHVHHILKRRNGGTDTLDNLITVWAGCHKKAESAEFESGWDEHQVIRGKD